eukprot:CAMPEP_0117647774 /NCGR_PEP_ID=MMETSP0804-20121206/24_1 /TAXON_ID=1074897 /ORGANISM="Tetraselmis astigmatica, Strain CCMP880" /LENGTH=51 /DNA_ID=CAMNT_0005453279 /DNA_START=395 /DNA_END=547 /DNA_ORIENTATION=-
MTVSSSQKQLAIKEAGRQALAVPDVMEDTEVASAAACALVAAVPATALAVW